MKMVSITFAAVLLMAATIVSAAEAEQVSRTISVRGIAETRTVPDLIV